MSNLSDRIGFHYFPDDQHFTQTLLESWLPILESLNARWPSGHGGDYRDCGFRSAIVDGLVRRGQAGLLEDLALAIHAFAYRRPLDWGKGGPARWPEAQPYHTPQGAQGPRGLPHSDWDGAAAG